MQFNKHFSVFTSYICKKTGLDGCERIFKMPWRCSVTHKYNFYCIIRTNLSSLDFISIKLNKKGGGKVPPTPIYYFVEENVIARTEKRVPLNETVSTI